MVTLAVWWDDFKEAITFRDIFTGEFYTETF